MRRYACTLFIALTALSIIIIAGFARPLAPPRVRSVRWAANVNPSWSGRTNILGVPDNRDTPLAPPLTITEFGTPMRYPDFGSLLSSVRPADLARADVIAFELGTAGVDEGFESGIWTFSDGVNTRLVRFNECLGAAGSDPRIVATGTIRGPGGRRETGNAAYRNFFRLCSPDGQFISFILFDLHSLRPVIDVTSRNFSISIENYHTGTPSDPACGPGLTGEGGPEPDAVGIFSTCSEK